jgi:hypothetical protein
MTIVEPLEQCITEIDSVIKSKEYKVLEKFQSEYRKEKYLLVRVYHRLEILCQTICTMGCDGT